MLEEETENCNPRKKRKRTETILTEPELDNGTKQNDDSPEQSLIEEDCCKKFKVSNLHLQIDIAFRFQI